MISLHIESFSASLDHSSSDLFEFHDLKFEGGIINLLIGDNGIGKSTILSSLAMNYDSDLRINKQIYWIKDSEIFKPKVGLIRQKPDKNLNLELTGWENLLYATHDRSLNPLSLFGTKRSKQKLVNMLLKSEMLGRVEYFLDQPVHTLSGGEKQLLSLCMRLASDINVLLLDEATASLDSTNKIAFVRTLSSVCNPNFLIISVTHEQKIYEGYEHKTIKLE